MEDTIKFKLSTLIHLAHIDGEFDIKEKAFIYNVGLRHRVDLDLIGDLIENPLPIGGIDILPDSLRAEYLTECLLLMLVDGKVLPLEILFCYKIAQHLGYQKKEIDTLVAEIVKEMEISHDKLHAKVLKITHSN